MTENKIWLIPGYGHVPGDPEHSPDRPVEGHFHIWEQGILKGMPTKRFFWYSARQGLKGWWQAFKNGEIGLPFSGKPWNTYNYAQTVLVPRAIRDLEKVFKKGDAIYAHSLGTAVALGFIARNPGMASKVVFMNGAAHVDVSLPIMMKNPDTLFLNIAVKTDNVLSVMGAWFGARFGKQRVIGNGLKIYPDNVSQTILDDKLTQKLYRDARGWDLRGNNPDNIGDHSYSFKWAGNWPRIREFFTGG